jgi:hypothetical protein
MKEISDYIYEGARILSWISIISDCYCERRFSWNQIEGAKLTYSYVIVFWCLLFGFSWKYGNENSN